MLVTASCSILATSCLSIYLVADSDISHTCPFVLLLLMMLLLLFLLLFVATTTFDPDAVSGICPFVFSLPFA